ncbi:Flagellar Member 1 [Leishmania donovani]|uniref:Flagellar_Member_1/GeneDB:LmjF.36.2790 n=1 Tax=Leishmania donovani TaxID=5661 RepID=A0A6J8FNZ4_LEIDO|nr:Flagellar Member 1 [Leishmania donovani]VDZ49482.1 Flagellar_Member_1/GeneDB:LmjF.36.2790 [Leishmania donovani]
MNSIFVLIRPHVWSPAVVDRVRTCLANVGACVDAEDTVSASTLLSTSTVERYFGSIHYWAASATDTVLRHPLSASDSATAEEEQPAFCAAEEDLKSLFYEFYGELWDSALDDGRLRTAFDVMRADNVSAAELASRCTSAGDDAVLALPLGLTVTRILSSDERERAAPLHYVVNGAYPAVLEAFRRGSGDASGAAAPCWWCVASWPSQAAPEVSQDVTERMIRLPHMLAEAASTPHSIDVFTGALEALACRVCWMNVPLYDDPFARSLVQRGLPLPWVAVLLRGPTLHEHGHFTDVFDMMAGKDEDDVAVALVALYDALCSPDSTAEGRNSVDDAAALYDWKNGCVDMAAASSGPLAKDPIPSRTYAVALVHPHLWSRKELVHLLEQKLEQLEVCVEAVREVSAEELEAKLDLHHGDVARYALDQEALRRFAVDESKAVAAEAMACFEKNWGVPWVVAMQEGRIWSASLAEDLLGAELAAAVLKHCATNTHKTHQLSATLSITELSRQELMTELNPACPVDAVSSASDSASLQGKRKEVVTPNRPFSLTSESYFVVNAAYAVYRRDVLGTSTSACASERAGGLWQLSWRADAEQQSMAARCAAISEALCAAASVDPVSLGEGRNETLGAVHAASYGAAVTESVAAAYPLVQVSADCFGAMRARHLWWGIPYEDDVVSRDLVRSQGQSWVTLHASFSASPAAETTAHEAVLALLPPVATTAEAIKLTLATLEESGVFIVEEADIFGYDAFDYVFSSSTALAVARQLAQKTGTGLWAMMSDDMQVTLRAAAAALADETAQPLTPENLYGGAIVCEALHIPLGALEAGWRCTAPICVGDNFWLGYLATYEVWVVNGHVPLLEHRYNAETARVHLLRVQWDASAVSWNEMREALVGQCSNGNEGETGSCDNSAAGSLTRLLSRIADRSPANTTRLVGEPLHVFSRTAYHALVDVLRWPRIGSSGPLSSEVALEDWLVRQPSVQRLLHRGASTLAGVVQYVRETLKTVLQPLLPSQDSSPSTPCWTARFAQSQRAVQLHHGFIWLHPSSTTPAVRDAVPALLLAHRVRVRDSGAVPLQVALERELLDVLHDSFFKNAYMRSAAEVPITDAEAQAFARHFNLGWMEAVQLGLMLNAKEAEEKYGTVHVMMWWESLAPEHQAKLSDSLFVGYMAEEGLYVMNAPYSYRRSRLHVGSHEVVWYAVEWNAADMSWDDYLRDVIGAADPVAAAAGSLRQHFGAQWTRYSLAGQPDEIECVLHASNTPLAALAERCRWLAQSPRQDPYGCLLLQSGVHPSLLSTILTNPSVYCRDTGVITEAFHVLPQEDVHALVRQLRDFQCTRTVLMLQDRTRLVPPATALATPPPPDAPHPREAEEADDGPADLTILAQLRAYRHVAFTGAVDPFLQCGFATAHRQNPPSPSSPFTCSAVLYLDPTCVPVAERMPSSYHTLRSLLEQQLRINGVRIVHERVVQCASAAEASVLYRCHHHREYRYGVAIPAIESLASSMQWQIRFKERFGVSYRHTSVSLYNAAEMSRVMQVTEREVAALCRRSKSRYPHDTAVVGEGCFIQRLQSGKPFYVMNGDVMEAEKEFVAAQATVGVRVWLLTWDSARADMGYTKLQHLIAELQAPTGVLRQWWASEDGEGDLSRASGLSTRGHDSPFLHVSESAVAAVRQRQLWWRLPVWSDPTVAAWVNVAAGNETARSSTDVSTLDPRTVAWALQDPLISVAARDDDGPAYLWDTVVGMDARHACARIRCCWAAAVADECNDETTRDTAVLTLAPQVATNSAVHHLVRSVLLDNGLRIDAHGFIADHGEDIATLKRTVQYLYPEDWSYAIEEPQEIQLNADEEERAARTFGTSWKALLDGGRLLPASRATKRLGGMTAPQLQLFVKTAKNSLWVRPHLHVAELEEYGVYVINAHVPYLAHTIAGAITEYPLPYYLVSWSPSRWSWKECLAQVFGCAEPTLAAPGSIRGRLYASWSSFGLHAAPEMAEGGGGGVCVSEGPLQSLLGRLHLQWPPLDYFDSDPIGSVVLRQPEPSGATALLRAWLRNPVAMCDGIGTGVLSHLACWDTREVLHLVETVTVTRKKASASETLLLPSALAKARNEVHEAEARRAAEAAREAAFQQRYDLPLLNTFSAAAAAAPPGVQTSDNTAESALLHRNVSTLLFFSHQLDTAQRALLRQHLQQHGVAVTAAAKHEEEEQECTVALLDRLYATEAFFADCPNLAAVLSESGEVAVEDQARFSAVFGDEVPWPELLARSALSQEAVHDADTSLVGSASEDLHQRRHIYSAADAMKIWHLTPHELWAEMRQGVSMRLSEGLEVTRLCRMTPGCASDTNERAVATDPGAPWKGHYVVNGLYAAVRDSLQAPAATRDTSGASHAPAPPSLTKWNVTWDAQSLSWHDLCQCVIGYADCTQAAPSSFNALLAESIVDARATHEEDKDEAPSPLSCVGVMAASGPLAAFAVRRYWCWNASHHDMYLPDPFLRAVGVAGMDHDVVLKEGWLLNPVMAVAPSLRHLRVFDWTRGCDTPAVLDWMHSREQMLDHTPIETTEARGASPAPAEAPHDSEESASIVAVAQTVAAELRPPSPPPRMKSQLQMAWVYDALLHASTHADYKLLWQHYRSLGAPAAAAAAAAAGEAASAHEMSNTISFALFYRDFKYLDNFGVPCMSHELKKLFIDIETQRRGRMTYEEFAHAIALYHSL